MPDKVKVDRIDRFDGTHYAYLSNFWPAVVHYDDKVYRTVEHAYQAAKTTDLQDRRRIRGVAKAGEAKHLGQLVTKHPRWEEVKLDVMRNLLYQKFANGELLERLMNTGDAMLIEGNYWHDNFWGDCYCDKCKAIIGENWLGTLLVEIREMEKNVSMDDE